MSLLDVQEHLHLPRMCDLSNRALASFHHDWNGLVVQFFPSSTISDITRVTCKQPRWELLHHGNCQILTVSFCFGLLEAIIEMFISRLLYSCTCMYICESMQI